MYNVVTKSNVTLNTLKKQANIIILIYLYNMQDAATDLVYKIYQLQMKNF